MSKPVPSIISNQRHENIDNDISRLGEGHQELIEGILDETLGSFSAMHLGLRKGIKSLELIDKLGKAKGQFDGIPVDQLQGSANDSLALSVINVGEQINTLGLASNQYHDGVKELDEDGEFNSGIDLGPTYRSSMEGVARAGDRLFGKLLRYSFEEGFKKYQSSRSFSSSNWRSILVKSFHSLSGEKFENVRQRELNDYADDEHLCQSLAFVLRTIRNGLAHPSDVSLHIPITEVEDFVRKVYPVIFNPYFY